MSTYISINIVSHALLLLKSVQMFSCKTIDDIRHLHLPIEINRINAFSFAKQIHWIICDDHLSFSISKNGLNALSLFDGISIGQVLWKSILYDYITVCSPIWAKRIPYGRKEAFFFMAEEEKDVSFMLD